jgi:hypothetical protein
LIILTIFTKGYPVATEKLEEVLELALNGQNVTTLWLPKMCRTEFAAKLQDKGLINSLTADKYVAKLDKTAFVLLNMSLNRELFFLQLDEELFNYSNKTGARAKIRELLEKFNKLVLIIDNFNFKDIKR